MKKLKKLFARYVAPLNAIDVRDFLPAETLRLNFRAAPLQKILDYMGDATGLIIEVKPNVAVHEKVDVWNARPLNHAEALDLLEQVLHKQGCTLIQNGRRLTIMRTADAKKSYIPIRLAGNYQGILTGPSLPRSLFIPTAAISSN